jgi:hypothetical protein
LSLTYPIKRSQGSDIRRSWWPGYRTISPNITVWKCYVQKPTNMWTPVWKCTILLETNLSNGKKYVCIPRSFLVINVCNQGKTLCSPCIFSKSFIHNIQDETKQATCFGRLSHQHAVFENKASCVKLF